MKRFRFRISSMLWLVAVAAAVLSGIRYYCQQDREVPGTLYLHRQGKTMVIQLSPEEMAELMASIKVEVHGRQKTEPNRGKK